MAFALMGDTDRAWALFNLLNPVRHGDSPAQIAVYKVEPYVVAADVYAVAPHTGRGGWTWYTGSAGWMYRLLIETLLGVNREGDRLRLAPRMPRTWRSYRVRYRHGRTLYRITFTAVAADARPAELVLLDGRPIAGTTVPLSDDGAEHTVDMKVPADPAPGRDTADGRPPLSAKTP
jgi:cellobiose phosphorylase